MRKPRMVLLRSAGQALPHNFDLIQRYVSVTVADTGRLGSALPGAEVLLLWDFFSNELERSWSVAGDLKWIHVAAAGVDEVIFETLRDSTVEMTNAHGIFSRPIAEFVLAAVLAHDKQLHRSKSLQSSRRWQQRELTNTAGTRTLVVGTGGIGREVARLLRAVGVEVRGIGTKARSNDPDFDLVLPFSELTQHVGWADHLVLAVPLTEETRHCVNWEVFSAMKRSGHLINVGRGFLVNEENLVQALRDGQLAAATLDVVEHEPLEDGHPFWSMENVHISPHISGDVKDWRVALADQFLEHLISYCAGKEFQITIDKSKGYTVQRNLSK